MKGIFEWTKTSQHTVISNSPLMCKGVHTQALPGVAREVTPEIHGLTGMSKRTSLHDV